MLLLEDVHIHNRLPLSSLRWTESADTKMILTIWPSAHALLHLIAEIEAIEADVVGVLAEVAEAPIKRSIGLRMLRLLMRQQTQVFATLDSANLPDPA